jgi:SH3-like domain-containing protein
MIVLCAVSAPPAAAQSDNNPSGLPLPRFSSTRSEPINVRVGPGTKYEIAWVFVKAGVPVEVIQEFDTWRKIRDSEGAEGWVHQNLLSARRTGYVKPPAGTSTIGIMSAKADNVRVRAWLGVGFPVEIDECDSVWCGVRATGAEGARGTYQGFVPQNALWGVYPDESFD